MSIIIFLTRALYVVLFKLFYRNILNFVHD